MNEYLPFRRATFSCYSAAAAVSVGAWSLDSALGESTALVVVPTEVVLEVLVRSRRVFSEPLLVVTTVVVAGGPVVRHTLWGVVERGERSETETRGVPESESTSFPGVRVTWVESLTRQREAPVNKLEAWCGTIDGVFVETNPDRFDLV